MKAQIHHANGELDEALESYKQAQTWSEDARRSIAFLEQEAITVPELTLVPLKERPELELEYAGVSEALVRVYKVDLVTWALRKKGVATAGTIEVAGIRPVLEQTLTLAPSAARRRARHALAFDLPDPGAYLVEVKAGDFFASGLVLRSDLSLTVQEEVGGTVRVNVTEAGGGFAEGVKVTMFGTKDPRFESGKTDLRGVWEAHGLRGRAVVVADRNGHVALHRGARSLGRVPRPNRQLTMPNELEILDNEIQSANAIIMEDYLGNLRVRQEGVEVKRAKR
jgi:hypothetical protein